LFLGNSKIILLFIIYNFYFGSIEREAARAVLTFFGIVTGRQKSEQILANTQAILCRSANQLVLALIESMVNTVHCNLMHYQAELLFNLIHGIFSSNREMQEWISASFANLNSPFLSAEERHRVAQLIWRLKDKRRFKAMMADFAQILSADMTADVLLSYEM